MFSSKTSRNRKTPPAQGLNIQCRWLFFASVAELVDAPNASGTNPVIKHLGRGQALPVWWPNDHQHAGSSPAAGFTVKDDGPPKPSPRLLSLGGGNFVDLFHARHALAGVRGLFVRLRWANPPAAELSVRLNGGIYSDGRDGQTGKPKHDPGVSAKNR